VLGLALVPGRTWLAAATGFVGLDATGGEFRLLPAGADFFLLGAFAAYSGAGGVANLTLSSWARDKGYGMGSVAGYIPGALGGHGARLAHTGFTFPPTSEAMSRWAGWWRIVRADQWGVFFPGVLLGMALPAVLYVAFVPAGSDIRGLGVAAALADALAARGPALGIVVAVLGAWLLFKTQLDILEGMVRAITDILWSGSARVRAWRGGDVRAIYYTVLGVLVLWGVVAIRLAQPIVLLQLGANVAGIVFVISSLHLLRVNTTLLPPALRPSRWRRAALVALAAFYGLFVTLWLSALAWGMTSAASGRHHDAELRQHRVRPLEPATELTSQIQDEEGKQLGVALGKLGDARIGQHEHPHRRRGPYARRAAHDPDQRHLAEAGARTKLADGDLGPVRPPLEDLGPPLHDHEAFPSRRPLLQDRRVHAVDALLEHAADESLVLFREPSENRHVAERRGVHAPPRDSSRATRAPEGMFP
jgi:hypothetical protein